MCLKTTKNKIVFCAVLIFIKILCFREITKRLQTTSTNIISCHYVSEGNVLPSAEDITPPPDSIFFHETSCRGWMTSRQTCAVESVARIHPERDIYVYFNSPVTESSLNERLPILLQFKNVHLARLHTFKYAKGTPLGEILARRENSRSIFPVHHTADMLRFVTLYKYGGVYLDTDMIVVKPLDALGSNWVGKEDYDKVSIAAMAFNQDEVGRHLLAMVLNEIKSDYKPNSWDYNGSGALTRSLKKFCNTSDVQLMAPATCHGFRFYGPEVIYPIHWENNGTYFVPGDLPKTIIDKAYTHHLWNMVTGHIKVEKDSPFDKLARKYCPITRTVLRSLFG